MTTGFYTGISRHPTYFSVTKEFLRLVEIERHSFQDCPKENLKK